MTEIPLALAVAAGLNFALLLFIAGAKLLRERRQRAGERIRESLLDEVIPVLESPGADPPLPPPRGLAGAAALETIVSLIAVLKGDARRRLVQMLERHGYIDALLERTRSRSAFERSRAASLLGAARSVKAAARLREMLTRDRSPDVRIVAAEALGSLGDMPAIPLLLDAARDPTRYQEVRIANVLAGMGSAAVEPLQGAIDERDARLTSIVLDILNDIGAVYDTDRVARLLEHRSPEIRSRAAALLGTAGAVQHVADLLFVTRDPVWFVRLRAVKALAALGVPVSREDRDAYFNVLEHLLYDEWWIVRRNAAAALAAAGDDGVSKLRSVGSDVAQAAIVFREVHRGRQVPIVV